MVQRKRRGARLTESKISPLNPSNREDIHQ